jgi:hypothetical protein
VAGFPDDLSACTGFEWDAGNADKNWSLHAVTNAECEQPFFNRPVVTARDPKHSGKEARYALLGQTNGGRLLSVVYTVRGTLVRVISARDMSRQERRAYERTEAAE